MPLAISALPSFTLGSCHVVLLPYFILDLRVCPGSYGYCGAGHDDPIISASRVV
jgi:hypothetical protein